MTALSTNGAATRPSIFPPLGNRESHECETRGDRSPHNTSEDRQGGYSNPQLTVGTEGTCSDSEGLRANVQRQCRTRIQGCIHHSSCRQSATFSTNTVTCIVFSRQSATAAENPWPTFRPCIVSHVDQPRFMAENRKMRSNN